MDRDEFVEGTTDEQVAEMFAIARECLPNGGRTSNTRDMKLGTLKNVLCQQRKAEITG